MEAAVGAVIVTKIKAVGLVEAAEHQVAPEPAETAEKEAITATMTAQQEGQV